jgi:hypothetical protein
VDKFIPLTVVIYLNYSPLPVRYIGGVELSSYISLLGKVITSAILGITCAISGPRVSLATQELTGTVLSHADSALIQTANLENTVDYFNPIESASQRETSLDFVVNDKIPNFGIPVRTGPGKKYPVYRIEDMPLVLMPGDIVSAYLAYNESNYYEMNDGYVWLHAIDNKGNIFWVPYNDLTSNNTYLSTYNKLSAIDIYSENTRLLQTKPRGGTTDNTISSHSPDLFTINVNQMQMGILTKSSLVQDHNFIYGVTDEVFYPEIQGTARLMACTPSSRSGNFLKLRYEIFINPNDILKWDIWLVAGKNIKPIDPNTSIEKLCSLLNEPPNSLLSRYYLDTKLRPNVLLSNTKDNPAGNGKYAMVGFKSESEALIKSAMDDVFEHYNTPNIIFANRGLLSERQKWPVSEDMGRIVGYYCGEYIFNTCRAKLIEGYENFDLVILDGNLIKNGIGSAITTGGANAPKNFIVHEVGHAILDYLDPASKKTLALQLYNLDTSKSDVNNNNCFVSKYSSMHGYTGDNEPVPDNEYSAYILDSWINATEQGAELFTANVYRETIPQTPCIQAKNNLILESLKPWDAGKSK